MLSPSAQSKILERLKRVVDGKVPVDVSLFSLDARLADIGVDSFSLIELVFLAEEEFGISIPVDGLRVSTVADVIEVISNNIRNESPSPSSS